LHLAGLTALAMRIDVRSQAPALFGVKTVASLQVRFAEALLDAPRTEVGLEEVVLVTPRQARVARQHFVEMPTRPPQHDGLPLPSALPPPAPMQRAADAGPLEADAPLAALDDPQIPRRVAEAAPRAYASAATVQAIGNEPQELPRPLDNMPPVYPPEAQRNGWQGTVVLRVRVSETGRVSAVSVASSSGHTLLDAAAASAVRQWRFRPARLGGRPVETSVRLPVKFELPP
ncbi:MAG: energy transducer TonB, partial [Pirellulales bacterium]